MRAMLRAWLVYDTAKVVRIYDKRLAFLYYGLVVSIVMYTFYSLVLNKGYFENEQPIGEVNIHLLANSTIRADLSHLKYCQEDTCMYWSESEVGLSMGTKDMLITTYVEKQREELRCTQTEKYGETCRWNLVPGSFSSYYIAGVDSIEIEIDHSAQGPVFHEEWLASNEEKEHEDRKFAGTCRNMDGVLMNPRGHSKKIGARFPKGQLDVIRVSELLAAGRCHLNDLNELTNKTYRATGAIVDIDLGYNNARCSGYDLTCAFGTVPLHYRYRVYKVPDAEFFYEEVNNYSQTLRERKTRYGVFIKVLQTGKISRFSWNILFINFTSGLGLLALAGLLVDVIAVYILPEKSHYSQRKFSEIARSGQKMSALNDAKTKTKKNKQS